MERPPQTQHEVNALEEERAHLIPDDSIEGRRNRCRTFDLELAAGIAGGATVIPVLTNDQASAYGPVFFGRMAVVVEVWRKHDSTRCSQMLSNAILNLIRVMEEAAAEPRQPVNVGPGPDTLEACALAGE
jgi:hypothetical protein